MQSTYRLNSYIESVEREQKRKILIQDKVETLYDKTKLKLKLQNSQSRREQLFNKRLSPFKKLKTFVDLQPQIMKMNLLNNPEVVTKLITIKNSRPASTNKATILMEQGDVNTDKIQLADEYKLKIVESLKMSMPGHSIAVTHKVVPQSKIQQPIDSEFVLTMPAHDHFGSDSNYFYNDQLFTQNSPRKLEGRNRKEENRRIQVYLQSQGILDSTRSTTYNTYYDAYHKQTDNLIRSARIKSIDKFNRESSHSPKFEISQATKNVLIANNAILKRHKMASSYQPVKICTLRTQPDQSPHRSQSPKILRMPCRTQRSMCSTVETVKSRVRSQLDNFTTAIQHAQCEFSQGQVQTRKTLRRMSTAIESVHKKYNTSKYQFDD